MKLWNKSASKRFCVAALPSSVGKAGINPNWSVIKQSVYSHFDELFSQLTLIVSFDSYSMTLHPVEAVLGTTDLVSFLEEVTAFVLNSGLPLKGYEIDHACYRCETKAQYKEVCTAIVNNSIGSILIESMISGRPITIVKFQQPIVYEEWSIPCLEITCPKPGRSHKHGFEHIEIVIDSENKHGFTKSQLFLTDFASQFPSIQFDMKAIHKEVNADLNLTTPGGNSVKFHARPIYEVCAYELSTGHHECVPADYFDEI